MRIDSRHTVLSNVERLRAVHDDVARDYGAALSDLLRTTVDARVAGVDAMTYGQFTRNILTPTCFYVVAVKPPDERLTLEVAPSILHPMIDRMLGGPVANGPPPDRPLTEIELSLAARLVRQFLESCRSAWSETPDLNLDILQVERDPRPARILPDDEGVAVVEFELAIGDVCGPMRFCLPRRFVEDRFPSPQASSVVSVALAETSASAEALADLRPGDIIVTETPVGGPASVSVDGVARFLGKPGTHQGRRAIRLTEPIVPSAQE